MFFYLGYPRGKLKAVQVVFSLVGATFGHDEIDGRNMFGMLRV